MKPATEILCNVRERGMYGLTFPFLCEAISLKTGKVLSPALIQDALMVPWGWISFCTTIRAFVVSISAPVHYLSSGMALKFFEPSSFKADWISKGKYIYSSCLWLVDIHFMSYSPDLSSRSPEKLRAAMDDVLKESAELIVAGTTSRSKWDGWTAKTKEDIELLKAII